MGYFKISCGFVLNISNIYNILCRLCHISAQLDKDLISNSNCLRATTYNSKTFHHSPTLFRILKYSQIYSIVKMVTSSVLILFLPEKKEQMELLQHFYKILSRNVLYDKSVKRQEQVAIVYVRN